jgi:hypothetical protein
VTGILLALALAAAPTPQIGENVGVEVPTRGPVVALLGDATIGSEVAGDVIALGGDVVLTQNAVVRGDVIALGGEVRGNAPVSGRTVAVAGLFAGTGRGRGASRATWGASLFRAGAWIVLGWLIMFLAPTSVRRVGERIVELRWRTLMLGTMALAVWLLAVVLALALAVTPLGVACLLLAVALFLLAKLAAIVGASWALGKVFSRGFPRRWRGEFARTGAVLVAVAAVSLLPVAGDLAWLAVTVSGIGAGVSVMLRGRRLALLVPMLSAR